MRVERLLSFLPNFTCKNVFLNGQGVVGQCHLSEKAVLMKIVLWSLWKYLLLYGFFWFVGSGKIRVTCVLDLAPSENEG